MISESTLILKLRKRKHLGASRKITIRKNERLHLCFFILEDKTEKIYYYQRFFGDFVEARGVWLSGITAQEIAGSEASR
jgi:hypothetical protein